MIKKLLVFGIALAMLFSLAACESCEEDTSMLSGEPLSAEQIAEIKEASLTLLFYDDPPYTTIENIFLFYYGSYNDSVVVMVYSETAFYGRGGYWDIFEIYYMGGPPILVWSDSNFYSLTEARDQGLLTTKVLRQIAARHKKEFETLYNNKEIWL